jgi:hypothetical protein
MNKNLSLTLMVAVIVLAYAITFLLLLFFVPGMNYVLGALDLISILVALRVIRRMVAVGTLVQTGSIPPGTWLVLLVFISSAGLHFSLALFDLPSRVASLAIPLVVCGLLFTYGTHQATRARRS